MIVIPGGVLWWIGTTNQMQQPIHFVVLYDWVNRENITIKCEQNCITMSGIGCSQRQINMGILLHQAVIKLTFKRANQLTVQ